jgi:eukaryotic-like serine/threonine-protein kinase
MKQVLTRFSKKSFLKPSFLLYILLLVALLLGGCTGSKNVPKGWSGVAIRNSDTIVLGSMDGRVVTVNTINNTVVWSVALQYQTAGGGFSCAPSTVNSNVYGTPAVDGDWVWVCGVNGIIHRIRFDDLSSKESYLNKDAKSQPQSLIGSPVVSKGIVYAGSSDGILYAMDTVSLEKRWQFQTGGKIWSAPVVNGDTVYTTSFDKKIYALDAATGNEKWQYKTEGSLVSAPVIENGTIYFGSLDRYFYALNLDGSFKWKFQGTKWFWSEPAVYNGVVYAANLDNKVYALNAANGNKIGEYNLGGPASSAPVLVNGRLIVAAEDGNIYSIDTASGQQKLLLNLGEKVFSPLAANGSKVYIHSDKDFLYELDITSGAKRDINIK